MAVTADLADRLDIARRSLEHLGDEVGEIGPWVEGEAGAFHLRFTLRPAELDPAGPIPPETAWYAVVSPDYPAGEIDLMPAAEGGITETYAHQLPNDEVRGLWRSGKVCLVDMAPGRSLGAARDEPHDGASRLHWHLWRTIGWLRRASHRKLLSPGEPFELPVFGQARIADPLIAFLEDEASFGAWARCPEDAGLAHLAKIGVIAPGTFAVMRWETLAKRPIAATAWGTRIAAAAVTETAIFLCFPELPVRPPWRAPQTWGELGAIAKDQGIDLDVLLTRATSAIRDGKSHFVLVGFPIPRVLGEAPSRMHWAAFRLAPLKSPKAAKTPLPGFRTHVAAPRFDLLYGALSDEAAIGWCRTENWAASEISARGRFEGGLAGRRIALLGAGALGAAIAPLLVRAGASEIDILDAGELEAGNLARHELGVADVGRNKAEALAERLNALTPTALVTGFASAFPPEPGPAREALDHADLVIDATTSDEVIEALAAHPWAAAPAVASVSFSFAAEHLYLYLAPGPAFPAADFTASITPWLRAHARPPEDFPHEGIGCWSSVFPARADDVALLAAVAVRQIDYRLAAPPTAPVLAVYGRKADGTVELLVAPPPKEKA